MNFCFSPNRVDIAICTHAACGFVPCRHGSLMVLGRSKVQYEMITTADFFTLGAAAIVVEINAVMQGRNAAMTLLSGPKFKAYEGGDHFSVNERRFLRGKVFEMLWPQFPSKSKVFLPAEVVQAFTLLCLTNSDAAIEYARSDGFQLATRPLGSFK